MNRAVRINMMREAANSLIERERPEMDLILREFDCLTDDTWHDGPLEYALEMLHGIGDVNLVELHEYLIGRSGVAAMGSAGPWHEGHVRVFMSHIHQQRSFVGDVKTALVKFGVDAFVAHDDIEPSQEWMNEIEIALGTCDALAAFLHPNFRDSQWCDQEVGYCLPRRVLIMPLMFGDTPHGFLSQWQGDRCLSQSPAQVAGKIFATCLGHEPLRDKVEEALLTAFENAGSFMDAADLAERLSLIKGWTPERIARVHKAFTANDQISRSFKARPHVEAFLQRHPVPPAPPAADDVPF